MLVPLLALLPERGNHVPERAQALVDVLRLLQPVLVVPRTARVQALAPREIDEVQRALACLARVRVRALDPEREDGVAARGALVHERRGDGAPRLRECEQRAHLRRRVERLDDDVRNARAALVVLDLVLLFVELALAEEVVDRLVVLDQTT